MEQLMEYRAESLIIKSPIPILTLLSFETILKENSHSYLNIKAVIADENQREVLFTDYSGEEVSIYHIESQKEISIFSGKIRYTELKKEHKDLVLNLEGISHTYDLDRKKQSRFYQDPNQTYESIVEQIAKDAHAGFLWTVEWGRRIDTPILQYEETNWKLLIRLASHYNTVIHADQDTGKLNFCFGMQTGRERKLPSSYFLLYGLSEQYYIEDGFEREIPRNQYQYLIIKHKKVWDIGDFIRYQNQYYYVYQKEVLYSNNELWFRYQLGTIGMTDRRKKNREELSGLRLKGQVVKTEYESVYMQFEFDKENPATYAWPYTPENGSLCYHIPEVGTNAVLYFPSDNERDGRVIHTIRGKQDGSNFKTVQHREFTTNHDKSLQLYPDVLNVSINKEQSKLSIHDKNGITLNSEQGIQICAKGNIVLQGANIVFKAPGEIVYQTENSNIEICKDFNLYAPNGVQTKGIDENEIKAEELSTGIIRECSNDNWQMLYHSLGAVPSIDLNHIDSNSIYDMAVCGAVPKIADGHRVVAMKEVMEGKAEADTSFPEGFASMGNYTVKGGYPLERELKDGNK